MTLAGDRIIGQSDLLPGGDYNPVLVSRGDPNFQLIRRGWAGPESKAVRSWLQIRLFAGGRRYSERSLTHFSHSEHTIRFVPFVRHQLSI